MFLSLSLQNIKTGRIPIIIIGKVNNSMEFLQYIQEETTTTNNVPIPII